MGNDSLEKIVKPDMLMRPGTLLCWNDNLDGKELRRQVREMAGKGWGSFFMHSTVGLVQEYLSDEFMDFVKECVDEAQKNSIYCWIYDENTWPSGFAGGLVPVKGEEYRARLLILLPAGQKTVNDTVLGVHTCGGVKYEICRRVAPLGNPLFKGTSHVDLMDPKVVMEFISTTFEKYKKVCGDQFGKTIPGVFTDEPSYISAWGLGLENERMDPDEHKSAVRSGLGASGALSEEMLVLPWSDLLPGSFMEIKGYDITEKLTSLFFDTGDHYRTRFDFYDVVTELFKKSFTKQYYDWCGANGLKLTGHFLAEDSLCYQTTRSGDVMSHYEYIHWPAVDKLVRNVRGGTMGHDAGIVTMKQVSSAAEQLGKERVLSESFAGVGSQVSFFHRKWIFDWEAVLGINFITNTPSFYSMRGERKRNYPADFFCQQSWWEDEKGLADYQARVCSAVSEGDRLVDILVIQPLTSVWCVYSPLHIESDFAREKVYDVPFERISTRLMERKLDFHYGNETLMGKYASAEHGTIKVGRHAYKCVILPPALNLKAATIDLLRKFAREGGRLITIGDTPLLADGRETAIDFPGAYGTLSVEEAVSLAGDCAAAGVDVIDVLTGANAPSIYVQSRQSNSSVRHFITNVDEKRTVHAKVVIHGCKDDKTAVIDLYDGCLYALSSYDGCFEATIYPAGSLMVVTGKEAMSAVRPLPAILGSGAAFTDLEKKTPAVVIRDFQCSALEENVFLLNSFILELEGREVYRGPVCGAWHTHFYPAKDGTAFKATYTFRSETDMENCFAVIEAADDLDAVIFNGELLKLQKDVRSAVFNEKKNWKDVSFIKLPLPGILKGENILVIEGKKINNIVSTTAWPCSKSVPDPKEHRPTEAEEIYICGKFSVKPLSESVYAICSPTSPSGHDLTHEGYPFYCGRMLYRAGFDLAAYKGARILLKLNDVEAASVTVRINGRGCGVLRWKPYILDITEAVSNGVNILEIEAAATMANAFGPNRRAGVKEEVFIHPGSYFDMGRYDEKYQLFDFGLDSAGIYILDKQGDIYGQ